MQKSMSKKFFCFILSVLMILSVFPVSVLAKTDVSVSSSKQLENALNSGAEKICIVKDFKIDRTFYVTNSTTIYSKESHKLTRDPSFGGDVFVVGENAKGKSALLSCSNVTLTLGKPDSKKNNLLIFDGNQSKMTGKVNGTFIFAYNSSVVNVYDNVTFQNSKKVGNKRTLDAKYGVSYPNRIGGAVAIIASGSMNVYGGIFSNNIVNEENTAEDATEEQRNSSQGGAIYNFGNLKIYGGTFSGNQAARGGAVYNYRTLKLYSGVFKDNNATTYGGAICQPGSQYARTYLGAENDKKGNKILFENNTAAQNGGALYTQKQSSLIAYGGATFVSNKAVVDNGGAIAAYGVANLNNVTFEKNSAGLRGGSIYLSNSDAELTTRFSKITDCIFKENSAKHGGAVAAYSADETLAEGAIVDISACDFISNTVESDGGAVYAGRKSKVTISDVLFENNSGLEGGALYVTGESTVDVTNTKFLSNKVTSADGCGGAITVRSSKLNINTSEFDKNSADKNGGAIYVSYVGTSKYNSNVKITDTVFTENTTKKYGGAIYSAVHEVTKPKNVIEAQDLEFKKNVALKGGALYLTAGSMTYFENINFEENTNTSVADETAEDYNGGAVYLSESVFEINGATFKGNSAKYNGGGLGAYSGSTATLNNVIGTENTAVHAGGFAYNSGSTINIYNSNLKKNSSEETGGAISLHSLGTTNVYKTVFEENTAGTHGGAAYVYTEASKTLLQDCSFVKNSAVKYGGAIYASKASLLDIFNITATENTANNGGVLYETTTDTIVTLNGITVSGNTASKGPIIYGNTTKAILNLNKANYVDSDIEGTLDDAYWKNAIANKLTVNEVSDSIPVYEDYKEKEKEKEETPKKKAPVSVNDVFNLGKKSSDADINAEYAALKRLDNSSNFMSRNTTVFDNINNNTVTVDTFVYLAGNKANNVSVGEGLLIYQALLYKKAHPDEEVYIDISSFRFSIEAAVNINRNSRYFGYMRNLVGQDYDKYGFVRISYLLITAAKMGIHVNVIGQMDGYPISSKDPNLEEYFTNQLNDPCDPKYVKKGVIGDYLNFQYCYWTSYDDNDATDMMHTKLCAVSDYIDMNGVEHKNAVWTSSSNLDGIKADGKNGNSKMQTATIVSDHEKIYRASANYLRLIAEYCGQEDVYLFRNLVNERTTKQIQMILAGNENKIPKKEQIVYLGGPKDDVFELYFAPFGGDAVVWDEVNNPYCKYLRKMYNSDDYILFTWNNANYNNNFALGKQIEDILVSAFHKNANPRNKIYLNLENFDGSSFDDLVQGKTIGYKSFNKKDFGRIHSKDMQISYSENGKREYVSILNSLNIHGGSMCYQSNNLLVIKEDNMDEDSVFYTIAKLTTKGIAENQAVENTLAGTKFNKNNKFTVGNLSATPYTIEATIQVPKTISGRAGVIVGNYDGGSGKQLNLEIVENGRVKLFFNTGSKKVSCVFSKDIRSAEAVNIAVTVSGNKATLYVNGVAVQTKTLSVSYSGITKNFVIGGDNRKGNGRYFKGTIYSVNLFSDVRTAQEIKNDCLAVAENTSGLIYTTHFRLAEQTYQDVKINGRTFDKNNAYSLGNLSKAPRTIEATIKVPKNIKGRAGVIVGNYNGGNGKQLNLEIYKGGKLRLFFNNGKQKVSCLFNKDLSTGAPVNIVVTIDDNSATLYVNGRVVETKTLNAKYEGATSKFKVGGDNRKGNGEYFKGTIYSVKLFSDIRTANEIKSDCNFASGNESGIIASRIFASQKKVYSCGKLTGRTFRSNTAYELNNFSKSPKTVEAVVNVPKTLDTRAGVVVGNYDGDNGKHINLEIYSGGRVRLFFHTGSKKVTATFSEDIRSDKPVHIAVTIDGKNATLYVDGNKSQTIKLSAEYKGATKDFKIGGDNRPGNPQYFKGTIYSVSLFSDVRTAKEIKRDRAAVAQNTSGLLYSGNLIIKNETYAAVKSNGAKYSADKFSSLENLQAAPKTIEAVVTVPKSISEKAGVIVGNYDDSKNTQLNLEVVENGKVKLFFNTGKEKVNCTFSRDIRSGTPVHIAVTINGKSATLYVNGEKIETRTLSATYEGSTDNFKVGGDNRVGNTRYFKGTIYSVTLFSDVRTQNEIKKDSRFVSENAASLLYSGRF